MRPSSVGRVPSFSHTLALPSRTTGLTSERGAWTFSCSLTYRGEVVYDVKGSVCCFKISTPSLNSPSPLCGAIFKTKCTETFNMINTSTPVYPSHMEPKEIWHTSITFGIQSFRITHSFQFGDFFYWRLLQEYTTCLVWMAAVVLPISPTENQNKVSLNPTEAANIKPCRLHVRSRYCGLLVCLLSYLKQQFVQCN